MSEPNPEGRIPDEDWPCTWCGHIAPDTHLRNAHLANCPMNPQETP